MAYLFGTGGKRQTVQDILEKQREERNKQTRGLASSYQQRLAAGDEYAGRDYALGVLGTFLGRKLADKYGGESPELTAARQAEEADKVAGEGAGVSMLAYYNITGNPEQALSPGQDLISRGVSTGGLAGKEMLARGIQMVEAEKARLVRKDAAYATDRRTALANSRDALGNVIPEKFKSNMALLGHEEQPTSLEIEAEQPVGSQLEAEDEAIDEGSTTSVDQIAMDAWFQKNRPGDPFMVSSGLPPAEREEARRALYQKEVLGIKPTGKPQSKGGITPGGTKYRIEGV